MRSVLGMLRIEFRRNMALLCFPLMVGVAWWFADTTAISGFYTWIQASAGVRQTILLVGPMIGGTAAWMAGRDHRRKMGELLAVTPRSPVSQAFTTYAGTALWGVAVYAALGTGIFALTLRNATWGAPLPGYFLVTLFAVVAHSALGFAVGRYLPSRFTAPLVAIVLFAAQILPFTTMERKFNYELLSPAPTSLTYRDVFQEIPPVAVQQSLWILGIAGVALAAIALKDRRRSIPAWGTLAASAIVAIVGFVVTIGVDPDITDAFAAEDLPYEPVCKDGEITVCVHPAYRKLLPEVARTINEVAAPVAGLPGAPTRALQAGQGLAPSKEMNLENAVTFNVDGLTRDEKQWFGYSIASSLFSNDEEVYRTGATETKPPKPTKEDLEKCGSLEKVKVPGFTKDMLEPNYETREIVAAWMLDRTVGRPEGFSSNSFCPNANDLVGDFASLKPAVREAWLKENFAGLRAGKVTLKDLP